MYQLLIDIHNFKQLQRVNQDELIRIQNDLRNLVRLYGARLRELLPGKLLIGFTIHRPSDTEFVVESVFGLFECLKVRKHGLSGFTLLLESCEDDVEGERYLRNLLIKTTEDETLWLGPRAATALAAYVSMESRGPLWKALVRNMAINQSIHIPEELIHRFSNTSELIGVFKESLAIADKDIVHTGVFGDTTDGISEIVHFSIAEILGPKHKRDFLWILGQNKADSIPIALTRSLFPCSESSIIDEFSPIEVEVWNNTKAFLFQNAYSPIEHVKPAFITPEFPLELFQSAWRLFMLALYRSSYRKRIPFIVHVENLHLLSPLAEKILNDTLADIVLSEKTEGAKVLIVFSGGQSEDIPESAHETITINPLTWDEATRNGLAVETLPAGILQLRSMSRIPRKFAVMIAYISQCMSRDSALIERLDFGSIDTLQQSEVQKVLVFAILRTLDDISQDVYYAIVISYGLLPLPVIFDFLTSLKVEKIRQPAIVQGLYSRGLIRDEELVIPSFLFFPDELEAIIGARTVAIRESLVSFLADLLKNNKLSLKLDTFVLIADIGTPDQFYGACIAYAQELLNARAFTEANYVLDYASSKIRAINDGHQHQRLLHAISYLNCRTLLLQNKTRELSTAFSHLDQLPDIDDVLINAFVSLQKSRTHMYWGDFEKALATVKRAVILFQDCKEMTGLAAAQAHFGQVLLAKERPVEARDYFLLARNNASGRNAVYEDVTAATHELIVTFLIGYQSRVLEALQDPQGVRVLAEAHGLVSHAVFLDFLKARAWFDIGNYTMCLTALDAVIERKDFFVTDQIRILFSRWKARCFVYLGEFDKAYDMLYENADSEESRLFLAEMHIRQEAYAEAINILDGTEGYIDSEFRLHPENISWIDGFSYLENKLIVPGLHTSSLNNLRFLLRSYAAAQLGDVTNSAALAAFIRQKNKSTLDPFNYLYLYLYSKILHVNHGSTVDDYTTMLGKAVKFLQERSSRIEEPAHKIAFLRESYWNRLLLQEAKIHNLA